MRSMMAAKLPVVIASVISNRPDASGLVYARENGVPVVVVDHRDFSDRAAFDVALSAEIDLFDPDLVVLAGFMRVLTDDFVRKYTGRLINIHPALLPAFPGLHTHERALSAGVKLHGCTVHFVVPEVDAGPIIAQAAVPVLADDTPDLLSDRVLVQEHRLYPEVVRWIAEGRVHLGNDGVVRVTGSVDPNGSLASPAY